MRIVTRCWLIGVGVIIPLCLGAQAIQAVRSVGAVATELQETRRDSVFATIARKVGRYEVYSDVLQPNASPTVQPIRDQLRVTIRLGNRAIERGPGDQAFLANALAFQAADERLAELLRLGQGRQSTLLENQQLNDALGFSQTAIIVPQSGVLVPGVVFSVGQEVSFPLGKEPPYPLSITTNLLGATAGSAFDLLGASTLAEYFTNNVSAGTGIPTHGKTKLTGEVGLGLGSAAIPAHEFGKARHRSPAFMIWPVLAMEQTDTADSRIPPSVVASDPQQGAWTTPTFSIAVVIGTKEGFIKRVGSGQTLLIPTLGVRFPYFYPGDPFTALAALFTNKRTQFQRAKHPQFTVGVDVPFLRLTPPSGGS